MISAFVCYKFYAKSDTLGGYSMYNEYSTLDIWLL